MARLACTNLVVGCRTSSYIGAMADRALACPNFTASAHCACAGGLTSNMRRTITAFLSSALATALLLTCARSAAAQSACPARPVRIVAPSAAGSAADTVARVIAPLLAERIGQPVVVDTRPGAATIAGTEAVAKAAPGEVIARLHREIVAILRAQDVAERFAREGAEVVANSPGEFDRYIAAEAVKWARVVRSAGIKPE